MGIVSGNKIATHTINRIKISQEVMSIMKNKLLNFSLVVIIVFALCSCQKKEIRIDTEESFYSDFEVKDEKVLIYCTILIENPTNAETNITLSANFDNDVKLGLLKESSLDGYQPDLETKTFKLIKGDNWIDVVFIGEYAGKNQKHDRLLPDIQLKVVE